MIKKRYILTVILIIVGVLAFKNITGVKEANNIIVAKEDLGIPIDLETVSRGDIVEKISYIGTISPKKSSTVSSAIAGQIKKMSVAEGSKVKAGDLLAKIEDNQLAASYATAEKKLDTLQINYQYLNSEVENFHSTSPLVKKLESATFNYDYIKGESEKYEELYEEGIVSQAEYDKIKQEMDTAHFQLQELQATIDDAYRKLTHEKDMVESQISEVNVSLSELDIKIKDTSIRAPISGVVKKLYANTGDLAVMGKPLVEIDNNAELIVNVNITESDLERINVGSKAILKVKGASDEITTTVSKVLPNINPNTRVGIVEIGPIKPQEGVNLVSGSSVEVDIIISESENKLVIPKSAIRNLNDENIVYLYDEGVVKETIITTGMTVGERTEVIEGLQEEDQIAINNLSKLYENAKVYIFKGVDQ